MKTNATLICKLSALFTIFLINHFSANSQCIAPLMVWKNAVLMGGTAQQVGAEYKFPSVITGVNAFVTIKEINGGATLTSVDDNTYGYSEAWQPVVKTPTSQGVSSSYVSFKVEFRDSATGLIHTFPCFQLSFIDVDGDNQFVKEFVAAKDAFKIVVSNVTTLTLTTLSPNFVQATGTFYNYPGIDTSAYVTNINFNYKNAYKIDEVRFGNVTGNTFTVQDRYSCGYFRPVSMTNYIVLPVKSVSLDGVIINNKASLKWKNEEASPINTFQIERSIDGLNFKYVNEVRDGVFTTGTKTTYQYVDDQIAFSNQKQVYYRIKFKDVNGEILFSNTVALQLEHFSNIEITASPNPVIENLNIRFTAKEEGVAEIVLLNTSGQNMIFKKLNINSGTCVTQLNGLTKLTSGIYFVVLKVNGSVAGKHCIYKN